MSGLLVSVIGLSWLLIGVGAWLGWQLLQQNGRMLLRLDELEKRLEELEFGELSRPEEAQSSDPQLSTIDSQPEDQSLVTSAATKGDGDRRASRFSNPSLARSRIKRDGLKTGTSAPSFRLPRLDGGELSLEELRGKRVLLVFSDPHCGPCNALAPELEKFHRANLGGAGESAIGIKQARLGKRATGSDVAQHSFPSGESPDGTGESPVLPNPREKGIVVVMISRGEPEENRAKVKEQCLTFPVVLQQRWEISRRYAMFATPVAYLIDEAGIIAQEVTLGLEPILRFLFEWDTNNSHRSTVPAARNSVGG